MSGPFKYELSFNQVDNFNFDLDDLWEFDLGRRTWKSSRSGPSKRGSYAYSYFNDALLVFGGSSDYSLLRLSLSATLLQTASRTSLVATSSSLPTSNITSSSLPTSSITSSSLPIVEMTSTSIVSGSLPMASSSSVNLVTSTELRQIASDQDTMLSYSHLFSNDSVISTSVAPVAATQLSATLTLSKTITLTKTAPHSQSTVTLADTDHSTGSDIEQTNILSSSNPDDGITSTASTVESVPTPDRNNNENKTNLLGSELVSVATIAGGLLLIVLIVGGIYLYRKRQKRAESRSTHYKNPDFSGSAPTAMESTMGMTAFTDGFSTINGATTVSGSTSMKTNGTMFSNSTTIMPNQKGTFRPSRFSFVNRIHRDGHPWIS